MVVTGVKNLAIVALVVGDLLIVNTNNNDRIHFILAASAIIAPCYVLLAWLFTTLQKPTSAIASITCQAILGLAWMCYSLGLALQLDFKQNERFQY